MKSIGNLFLAWYKDLNSQRIVLGKIKSNTLKEFSFKYDEDGVASVLKAGGVLYMGFPNSNEEYDENVQDIFAQRISKTERNDLTDFYNFWKVDTKLKDNLFYMLAKTEGRLPTDNFEILADFNPIEGLDFISELVNLPRIKSEDLHLIVGDYLDYKFLDENSNKVEVFKEDLRLGDIKVIHSRVFHKARPSKKIKIRVHHIEMNGVIRRIFINIYI